MPHAARPTAVITAALLSLLVTQPAWANAADVSAGSSGHPAAASREAEIYSPAVPYPDGLITNDFAHWNPGWWESVVSPDWDVTNGSLFTRDGWWYSGRADTDVPDAHSRNGTGSAVFRMTTRRSDFRDVALSFDLSVWEYSSTHSTPAHPFDGVHVWMRYQDQTSLYLASVARRDGQVVIKKKCHGGRVNGGTYYELSTEVPDHPAALLDTTAVTTTIRTNADGSVTITVTRDGSLIAQATDPGTGCAPITRAGAVGVRGDNTRFLFREFTVSPR
ncbi:MAG: hypothetical protein JXA67_19560 [Micromonosporaceae bacterium]|nr:hypothetical protein [Micromonosporaceae bacterium]